MVLLGYALAVLIGVTLGLLGGGGAILTVPVLVYVMGVGMKQAVPMSLVVVGLTSLLGVVRHRNAGNVNLGAALAFGPAAILGSLLGTTAALRVSARFQLTVFAVVLLAAAALMLRGRGPDPATGPRPRKPWPFIAGLGSGVGFLTGLVGVGGGFLYVPALTVFGGLEMRQAVGTSLALIALSCAAGLAGYVGRVPIDWAMVGIFSVLAFIGVGIGSALVPRVPQAVLRKGFAVFILLMGVLVLARR